MPIAIGPKPSSEMRLGGTTKTMSEPSTLLAMSSPIPAYCPATTLLATMLEPEKNIISKKMSSTLVAAKATTPIAIKPMASIAKPVNLTRVSQ